MHQILRKLSTRNTCHAVNVPLVHRLTLSTLAAGLAASVTRLGRYSISERTTSALGSSPSVTNSLKAAL